MSKKSERKPSFRPGSPLHSLQMLGQCWPEMMLTLARIEKRLALLERRIIRVRKAGGR